jgi:hypothetical protein
VFARTSRFRFTIENLVSPRMGKHRYLHLCVDALTLPTVVANGGSSGIDGIRGQGGNGRPKAGQRPRKPSD